MSARKKRTRRSSTDLRIMVARIAAYVRTCKQGAGSSQIGQRLHLGPAAISYVLRLGVKSRQLRKTGKTRGTRYFVGARA